jgi:hypothetical protein
VVLQRRVEQRGEHEHRDEPEHRDDELDDEQVRPHHRGVLDALVDPDDRVLPHEGEQPQAFLLAGERLRPALEGHSGPEIPPSFRMRQKWMAIRKAVASGRATTWRT